MTLRQAVIEMRAIGLKLSKTTWDEYRVTFRDETAARAERMAYYSADLLDATNTGRAMVQWRAAQAARKAKGVK